MDGQLSLEPSKDFSNKTSSGKSVTVDSALQLSTVWACVRFVSETASTLPLKLYEEKSDGGRIVAKNHPLYYVLCKAPNYEMTQ
ncbi:phage portal protein, partial [Mycobacterium tuberculosis]|nr:phage portal protein [Mycobacterium tuberculosis]